MADPTAFPARFDPVRRRYLDALARRAAQVNGPARALLAQRLAAAQAAYDADLAAARTQAVAPLHALQARFPAAAGRLQQLWDQADFAALDRLGRTLADAGRASPLVGLLAHIDQGAESARPATASGAAPAGTAAPATPAAAHPTAPRELRAVRGARSTWTRLRVERQLAQSLARLPDNPGPLNSQRLVLRCLQRLQALSPAYLACLMAQLDTLVWLEQASPVAPREAPARPATKAAGPRGKAR